MTDQNDVDVYLGPYEQWLYFDGKAYAFPQIRQFQSGFLTGLIEWDQPVSPVPRNSEEGVAVPTVWNGEGHFQSRFLPVVRAFENMSFEDAIRDLEQFAREEHPQSVSGCPFPRLRVNYPLPIATLRPGYDPAYNDHWSPDPATLAYLDRQPAGKRRLSIVGVIEDGIPFAHRHFRTLSRRARNTLGRTCTRGRLCGTAGSDHAWICIRADAYRYMEPEAGGATKAP